MPASGSHSATAWSVRIPFEGGEPVAANVNAELSFEKSGDLFIIRVGEERYAFPEALVNGG